MSNETARKRIKLELGDGDWVASHATPTETGGYRIELDGAAVVLPPHAGDAKNLLSGGILTGLAVFAGNVAAGVVAAFLYDALQSGRLRRLFVAGREVQTEEEIENALLENASADKEPLEDAPLDQAPEDE